MQHAVARTHALAGAADNRDPSDSEARFYVPPMSCFLGVMYTPVTVLLHDSSFENALNELRLWYAGGGAFQQRMRDCLPRDWPCELDSGDVQLFFISDEPALTARCVQDPQLAAIVSALRWALPMSSHSTTAVLFFFVSIPVVFPRLPGSRVAPASWRTTLQGPPHVLLLPCEQVSSALQLLSRELYSTHQGWIERGSIGDIAREVDEHQLSFTEY